MPAATATLSDSTPGASGMATRRARRRGERRTHARAFVADHQRERRAARAWPAGRAARRPPRRRPARRRAPRPSATKAPASAETAGSRNAAPMLPRSTLGLVSSAVPLSATTPAAPSAERGPEDGADVARVLHRRRARAPRCRRGVGMSSRRPHARLDHGDDALRLLGVGQLVELGVASPRPAGTPRAVERDLERRAARSTFQRRRDGGARAPARPPPAPPRPAERLRPAPVRGARGPAGGRGRGSSSAAQPPLEVLTG